MQVMFILFASIFNHYYDRWCKICLFCVPVFFNYFLIIAMIWLDYIWILICAQVQSNFVPLILNKAEVNCIVIRVIIPLILNKAEVNCSVIRVIRFCQHSVYDISRVVVVINCYKIYRVKYPLFHQGITFVWLQKISVKK